MTTLQLIATAAAGLEAVVARELVALGYDDAKTRSTGRVAFTGDEMAVAIANIHLRTGERVLIEVGRFGATDFGQLFDQTFALPWDRWLGPRSTFPVNGRSAKSQLSSVPACQRIVKKAIVEKLCRAHNTTALPEDGPRGIVEVSLLENVASITLDTTGVGLHKRGYRTLSAAAPLRETLAAALVMLSFWKPERPLIDPFCGSGTIAIEAALIGRGIAPGADREFDAESWPATDASLWSQVRDHAKARITGALPERIIAKDIDPEVLSLARYHAKKAGVEEDIHFQQADFLNLTSKRQYGCLITNPPYGKRIGERLAVEGLYAQMPLVLRKLPTWSHYILTGYEGFEKLLGREADRRRKLYNGPIQCTYYQFHGPRPGHHAPPPQLVHTAKPQGDTAKQQGDTAKQQGDTAEQQDHAAEQTTDDQSQGEPNARPSFPSTPVIRPAFGGLDAKAHEQAEIFANRLTKTARHLRRWPTRRGITCYRLYDRDIPEIPLTVDRYEDHLHMAEVERPHERSLAEHADWLDLMVRTAAKTLGISPRNVFLKRRERQRGSDQYQKTAGDNNRFLVSEGGLRFEVNLSDYIDTGLFLDHRITRGMFAERAAGRDVLNLFCYTGAFTIYAAAAGAAATVSVDQSNTYLNWLCANLAHNRLEDPKHRTIRDDVVTFLDRHDRTPSYDLAIVDPPTFSNSKSNERVWDVQRDHAAMLRRLLELMRPQGQVFFSTNFRRFRLDESALAEVGVREISKQTIPEDFRNKRIHRCWVITKP